MVASGASSIPSADASPGWREQAVIQIPGAVTDAAAKPGSSVASSEETFAAMDASFAPGRQSWGHTGAQQAEAGFQDPALGWVGVRADSSSGGIHAELVAGSPDAAVVLSGHMAGINAFLAEHHTPVETLTLSTTGGGAEGFSDRGSSGGMQQRSGEQTGDQLAESAGSFSSSRAPLPEAALSNPAWPAGFSDSAQQAQWVGGHISVMA
jgi:hypothetical protein